MSYEKSISFLKIDEIVNAEKRLFEICIFFRIFFFEFKRKCEFVFFRRCFLISFSICDQFQLFHFELNFEFIFIDLLQFDALLNVFDFSSIASAKDSLRVLLHYVSIANNS